MTTKRCSKCGQEKDLAAFSVCRKKSDGLQTHCKACNAAHRKSPQAVASRAAYKASPSYRESSRRTRLKLRFGITTGQYAAILAAQGGGCAVCGAERDGSRQRSLNVDHDHVTGEVRGLLCTPCNTAIGKLRDSTMLLAKAAAYLTRPPAREILATLGSINHGELR